ncbi:hypothetical protein VC636_25580 [Citrobacter freundii]|uniref:hypothetical protein n=1 Tax=Citrobacter freundii TaxID=546 RepID=UPI00292C7203|nr:hypothetical protein [Citrobacter freundii]MDV0678302.1 hypothetical protein [Citrobacter freundii]MDV0860794.1 hypothetical protein [Citrobacter freundii]MEB0577835.1 hypothetical protein [Citrobacter freundii]MEB0714281.1 hypothetical protein [Citrobacter freundii]
MIELMQQHYEEQTPYILVDHVTPTFNSLPYSKALMGNKKTNKVLKKSKYKDSVQTIMNIAFDKLQECVSVNDVIDWSLCGVEMKVVVLETNTVFVKGQTFWFFIVGIIEE